MASETPTAQPGGAAELSGVEKDRQLEATERERIVGLATIEKEKAICEAKRCLRCDLEQ